MRAEEPVDVLVIGGACAALCAAIAARRAGARVRLLERASRALRGGNTKHARNFRIAHDVPLPDVPDTDPRDEFTADLERVTGGASDHDIARTVIHGSTEIVAWLAGAGVAIQHPSRGVLPYSRRTAFLAGGGKAMVNALYATAGARGVVIDYDARVCDLSWDEPERCRVTLAGGHVITSKTVVVCAGGQAADLDRLRESFGALTDHLMIRGTSHVDGGVMERLIARGAREVGDRASGHIVAVDARGPRFDGGIVTRITSIPYGVVVDRDGHRLDDERSDLRRTHYAKWGPRIAAAPGAIAYLVMDRAGVRRAPVTALAPISAPTLPDLAARLDIDATTFLETIARFADENDPTPGRSRRPIVDPPFAAWPLRPGLTFTHHGVVVDERMRVVTTENRVLDDVFAAGTIMAANVLGRGYLAGLGVTLAAVTGRIAGEEAARRAAA